MSALIEIRDVSKAYTRGRQSVEVLHHVTLDILQGDFLALMGPSGSGKTTLLNLIGGLDSPTGGSIAVGGKRIDTLGGTALAKWRSENVGFIFQFYNLLPMLTAQKNVEVPLLLTKLSAAERRHNASIALTLVNLADRASHKPNELSGGQQQRVAIARAIVGEPRIILADEPTGNLDTETSFEIMALFQDLSRSGITIVLVTHEPDVAQHARRQVRFLDGVIVSDRPTGAAERPEALPC